MKSYRELCQVKDGRRIYGEVRLYGFFYLGRQRENFKYLCSSCLR